LYKISKSWPGQHSGYSVASTSTELSVCRQPGPADVSPRQFSSLPYFSLVDSFSVLCTGSDFWPSPPSRFPPTTLCPALAPAANSSLPIQPIGPRSALYSVPARISVSLARRPLPQSRLESLPIDGCLYYSKF
jgi:hypothetical protein